MPTVSSMTAVPAYAPGDAVYLVTAAGDSRKLVSLRVETIAAMQDILSPTNGMSVVVTAEDGGLLVFDTSATATGDNIKTYSANDSTPGSWVRRLPPGVPSTDDLASSKIGIVAGSIRQDATTRTRWNYISDANHTPIGVSGTFATATGGSITITFDTTYSRVISFVAGPDETFANRLAMSVGASVGLSNVVLNASAPFNGAFTVEYDGADWNFVTGTGQEIAPVFTSYVNGTLRVTHGYCRGIAAQVSPWSKNGALLNPYMPILKNITDTYVDIQWIDTTTGNIVIDASPNSRMKAAVSKQNTAGLFLDGTNNATVINGLDISASMNIWFYGIFEK